MERPTFYHEIIQPSKEILLAMMRGLNQVFFPEDDTPNTGGGPALDRALDQPTAETYGQGTLFDVNGIHRDSIARGDEW